VPETAIPFSTKKGVSALAGVNRPRPNDQIVHV